MPIAWPSHLEARTEPPSILSAATGATIAEPGDIVEVVGDRDDRGVLVVTRIVEVIPPTDSDAP